MTLTFKILPIAAAALMMTVAPVSFTYAESHDSEKAMDQAAALQVAFEGNAVEVTTAGTEIRVLLSAGMDFLLAEQLEGFGPQTAGVVLAESLREYPESDVRIASYSAADGALLMNDAMGIAHGQALADMLIAEGVAANRILIDGAENAEVGIGASTDMDPTRQLAVIITLDNNDGE
jgi:hypothetical protein